MYTLVSSVTPRRVSRASSTSGPSSNNPVPPNFLKETAQIATKSRQILFPSRSRIRGACHVPRDSWSSESDVERTSGTWSRFVVHHRFNHDRNVTETRAILPDTLDNEYYCPFKSPGAEGFLRARSISRIDSSRFLASSSIKDSLERSRGISRKSFDLSFFFFFSFFSYFVSSLFECRFRFEESRILSRFDLISTLIV